MANAKKIQSIYLVIYAFWTYFLLVKFWFSPFSIFFAVVHHSKVRIRHLNLTKTRKNYIKIECKIGNNKSRRYFSGVFILRMKRSRNFGIIQLFTTDYFQFGFYSKIAINWKYFWLLHFATHKLKLIFFYVPPWNESAKKTAITKTAEFPKFAIFIYFLLCMLYVRR